jgi:uncharacterized RDD family membrane protein YckC
LFNKRKQALHDKLAGTIVVRMEMPEKQRPHPEGTAFTNETP